MKKLMSLVLTLALLILGIPMTYADEAAVNTPVEYYRSKLTSVQDSVYQILIESTDNDGINDCLIEDRYFTPSAELTLSVFPNEVNYINEMQIAVNAFLGDHPEVNWLANARVKQIRTSNSTVYSIELASVRTKTEVEIKAYLNELNTAVNVILQDTGVTSDTSRYEIICKFNDWLTLHNSYNSLSGNYPDFTREGITALKGNYGVNGPVCGGYSKALEILCHRFNIPCIEVYGIIHDTYHAWNIIQMENGNWYTVDVTWNDPGLGNWETQPVTGYETHTVLLLGNTSIVDNTLIGVSHSVIGGVINTGIALPSVSDTVWK